jgi:hypothetical protein
MLLNREAILAAQDIKSEDVDVPEWGGSVRVRMMTGSERDGVLARLVGAMDAGERSTRYRSALLAACLVGEDGVALFGPDEVAQLAGKSATALDRVFKVAERLNDASPVAVEAAEKN